MDQKLDDILNMLQAEFADEPQAKMSGLATPPVRQPQATQIPLHWTGKFENQRTATSLSHSFMSSYFWVLVSQDLAVSWVKWNIILL